MSTRRPLLTGIVAATVLAAPGTTFPAPQLSVDYWHLQVPAANNLIWGRECVRISGGGVDEHSAQIIALGYNAGPNGINEEGQGDDVSLGPVAATWETVSSLPDCNRGTRAMTDSPGGNYGGNRNTSITYGQSLSLAEASSARLVFFHHFSLKSNDYVDIEVDAGSGWEQVDRIHDTSGHGWVGGPALYVREETDLSAYVGNSIDFRFRFVSSSSGSDDGWFVDDIRIEADRGPVMTEDWESGTGAWNVGSFWGLSNNLSASTIVGNVNSSGLFTATDRTGVGAVRATLDGESRGMLVNVIPPKWVP